MMLKERGLGDAFAVEWETNVRIFEETIRSGHDVFTLPALTLW